MSVNRGLTSGAGLASQAFMLSGGNPFITAGAGVVGLLSGIFGDSEEDVRERRKNELLASIAESYSKRLVSGYREIARQGHADRATAERRARERMSAEGFAPSQAETVFQPLEAAAGESQSKAVGQYTNAMNQWKANAEEQVQYDWAGRPIEPSLDQTLLSLGSAAVQMKQNVDAANLLKDQVAGGVEIPVEDPMKRLGILPTAADSGILPERSGLALTKRDVPETDATLQAYLSSLGYRR